MNADLTGENGTDTNNWNLRAARYANPETDSTAWVVRALRNA
jgi:hypothetical protein